MNENYHDWHHRNTTRTFIYTKSQKVWTVFIYKNPDTVQKARQFPLRLYIYKAIQLTLLDFHEIFEVDMFIQKAWRFALRNVFIYKNLGTSQKARQFAIRFYIQKSGIFSLRNFSLNFWNLRRKGRIYSLKNNSICMKILHWIK